MLAAPETADESQRIREEIRKELGDGFHVVEVEPVFFVASNAGRTTLDACRGTISRVTGYLSKKLFTKQPTLPIRVFLFRDKETYEEYCEKTYGRPPGTPFGFYMSQERKMVMNIATGSGTLAHELVHPLLAEDFPGVPSWFNEGFASLFEQSRATSAGKMRGLVNWRLPALRQALRSRAGVPLEALLKTTAAEFYGDNRGIHYAAARYLVLYLQERGLLERFYREFRKGFQEDPTGRKTLERVTGIELKELQRLWRRWVLALRWKR